MGLLRTSVGMVTHNRVALFRQVHANLMLASRFKPHLYESSMR